MLRFTFIFASDRSYRFEESTVRDFTSALDCLLSAELKPRERPFGIWHENKFYEFKGGTLYPAGDELTGKVWVLLNRARPRTITPSSDPRTHRERQFSSSRSRTGLES